MKSLHWWVVAVVVCAALALAGSGLASTMATRSTGNEVTADVQIPGPNISRPVPVRLSVPSGAYQGGDSVTFTVTFDQAYATDQIVSVTSDHPEAFTDLPSSVTVPAGYLSQTFSVTAANVTQEVVAVVTVTHNTDSAATSVDVQP